MIVVQTHWSKPNRWEKQHGSLANMLYMYASSAFSMKKNLKTQVGMVTDSSFASILRDLPMPYDFITTDLDEISGVDQTWWAFPKFFVFQKYAPQVPWLLQCDTDVFFWDEMEIGEHVDLLVQSMEAKDYFMHSYKYPVAFFDMKMKGSGVPSDIGWDPTLQVAYNCGVVGFKDGNRAKEYAENAMKVCREMSPYMNQFNDIIPPQRRAGTGMVVAEQYYLANFAKNRDLYTAFIATMKRLDGKFESYDPEDYYHAMASKKDPKIRALWKTRVEKEQPALYRAIQQSAYAGL